MNTLTTYFKGAIAFTIFALCCGYYMAGWAGVYAVIVLGLLESSLSVDNAVVDAKVLTTMSVFWRKIFLYIGMLVAVFGMRVIFPILIVSVMSGHSMWDVGVMAVNDPKQYAEILTSSHNMVAGFGGAFLMMVFLKFFLNDQKDHHWFHVIEAPLAKIGKIGSFNIMKLEIGLMRIAACFAALYAVKSILGGDAGSVFFTSGAYGVLTFMIADGMRAILHKEDEDAPTNGNGIILKTGWAGFASFMYLEVMDASFSFDGVIGAFAITTDITIIALGLGIGAFVVRSMCIMLVEKGTLEQYEYLEHGAFYAIGTLAAIMFVSTFAHIPEAISGTIGAAFVGFAVWASIRKKKNEVSVLPA